MSLASELAQAVSDGSDLLTCTCVYADGELADKPLGEDTCGRLDYSLDGDLAFRVDCTPVDGPAERIEGVIKLPASASDHDVALAPVEGLRINGVEPLCPEALVRVGGGRLTIRLQADFGDERDDYLFVCGATATVAALAGRAA